jgi:hypothetical protein
MENQKEGRRVKVLANDLHRVKVEQGLRLPSSLPSVSTVPYPAIREVFRIFRIESIGNPKPIRRKKRISSSQKMVLLLDSNGKAEKGWRCRDLNPGHCGYEPHALTN